MDPAKTELLSSKDDNLIIYRREDRSGPMKVLLHTLRPLRPHLAKSSHVFPPGSPKLSPPNKVEKRCNVRERRINDIWIYDITGKPTTDGAGTVDDGFSRPSRVYYFSGGGWQRPPSDAHWAFLAELATSLPNTTITLIAHPLAPECPAAVTLPQLRKLYDVLMEESAEKNERVTFAGDSSGGNIALCLVTWALGEPAPSRAPDSLMVICPSVDLRHIDPELEAVGEKDPMLTLEFVNETARAWYAGSPSNPKKQPSGDPPAWDVSDPRVSPILANLRPLVEHGVRVNGVTGTDDVLAVEAVRFRDRLRQEGVVGEWLEWDGQMHCFPMAFPYGLKESKEAVDWITEVLRRELLAAEGASTG